MKHSGTKILAIVTTAFLFIIAAGCTTNTSGGGAPEGFSLVSPKGIILADDLNDLKNIIIHNSDAALTGNDIAISAIRYNETDKVSFGIVNFTINTENRSMLVPLKIDDHLALLVDGKNIYIREIAPTTKVAFERRDAIYTNTLTGAPQTALKTAYVCNGGCCQWSQVSEDHYHCGCALTAGTELVLSTSDDCVIQVLEDPPQQ